MPISIEVLKNNKNDQKCYDIALYRYTQSKQRHHLISLDTNIHLTSINHLAQYIHQLFRITTFELINNLDICNLLQNATIPTNIKLVNK